MTRRVAWLVVGLIAVVPALARAQAAERHSLRMEVGSGSGFENGTVTYGWRAADAAQLEVGVGAGLLGLGAHVTARVGTLLRYGGRLMAGLGLAATLQAFDSSLEDSLPMWWVTADVGLQHPLGGEWFLWGSAGATIFVSEPAWPRVCTDVDHMQVRSFIGLAALLAAAGTDVKPEAKPEASATLKDTKGRVVGEATLRDTPTGVLIDATFSRELAGNHAFHIHEKGKCEPPFDSAGGHFSPDGKQHGLLNPKGPHAGDLPNIHVPASEQLRTEVLAPGLTLRGGGRALLDTDGASLMVHEHEDDYRTTDPPGHAGGRVACGVIK